MVVARASGTDLASSLKQNTFLTLEVHPAGGVPPIDGHPRVGWASAGVPPYRRSPNAPGTSPPDLHRRVVTNLFHPPTPYRALQTPAMKLRAVGGEPLWGVPPLRFYLTKRGTPPRNYVPGFPSGRTSKVKNVFRFKLDAKSVPEALATTILILQKFSIDLAHRQNPGASAHPAPSDTPHPHPWAPPRHPLGTPGNPR